ncbi:DUF29 domain-containing protein [Kingella kingae]|uniref:DUF29 domain-containing protein n=1 Tax=Kingella kingae TaxID=504 RepID=UPI0025510E19|nr:DUF29 domain-containing protein [Kingella kingae]MDK4563542.1 DUF29 domain-containing protein [Kingella kingae]MDK4578147.1 DUF29 domain-containing protein [Kingella kingae]MDK4608404.1 DUF29 domain-containing protein [Kingella kingae]MDK4625712.1 DUF29 domain-containing protein [Kingella kingae]MDK4673578.1 DUF29 domain-containing protein [Kingella kingae]
MQTVRYENDFAAWAFQQAGLMRAGKLNHLDLLNLIEEMESMGRSEHRQLESRLSVLIGHLLKWKYQPERQGNSWRRTINAQRKSVMKLLKDSPSLKAHFDDEEWLNDVWDSAVTLAMSETDLDIFPEQPIWTIAKILDNDFLPE